MENVLYVTFFGRFTLSCDPWGGTGVAAPQGRSSGRLWAFLQYLCAFHQKGASQEELIEALWEDSEVVDPVGALKTMLHRARTLLEELGFPDGKKVLLYRQGRYSWAPEVEFRLDTEKLDYLYARFAAAPDSTLPDVLQFLPEYAGDFLPQAGNSSWALSLRTFYHTRYLQLSLGAAKLLWGRGRFDEAVTICQSATTLDPYDERCQLLLIRLLHDSGAAQAALRHYSMVSELYMNQLGISPSPEMLGLFQEISKAGGEQLELHTLRDRLLEKDPVKGPFFCEYTVFEDIYRLTARSMPRTGEGACLVLLTIDGRGSGMLEARRRAAALESLRETGLCQLRPADVAAQAGPGQMLLLLPSTSEEKAQAAVNRILSAFGSTAIGKSAAIRADLLPVLPPADGPLPGKEGWCRGK